MPEGQSGPVTLTALSRETFHEATSNFRFLSRPGPEAEPVLYLQCRLRGVSLSRGLHTNGVLFHPHPDARAFVNTSAISLSITFTGMS